MAQPQTQTTREKALQDYRKKLLEHGTAEGRLKEGKNAIVIQSTFQFTFNHDYI